MLVLVLVFARLGQEGLLAQGRAPGSGSTASLAMQLQGLGASGPQGPRLSRALLAELVGSQLAGVLFACLLVA